MINDEITPGPGSYEGNSANTGPKYTMQGSKCSTKSETAPGPGQYSPTDYTKITTPAYRIGTGPRIAKKKSENPGPGTYNLSPDSGGPKWKVGTEPRLSSTISECPGPGAYECASNRSMPAFSMTARRPLSSDSSVPGPGAYSPKSPGSSIHYSVGNASRDYKKTANVPGPASYFIEAPRTRSVVFGSGQRKFMVDGELNPEPGAYTPKNEWDGPKYTARSRNTIKSALDTPVGDM